MRRITFIIMVLGFMPSAAMATSGWERHEVTVAGFRIHGSDGGSFVHRTAADGTIVEPALCNNLSANLTHNGLGGPPDYAVTKTHLVIRYPILRDGNAPPNHFLIRIEDGQVTGPLTETQFRESPLVSVAELRWKRPLTASDQLDRVILGLKICLLLGVLATVVEISRRVRKSESRIEREDVSPRFSSPQEKSYPRSIRILYCCLIGFAIGAPLGAAALSFLLALTCLPSIIQQADWGNNFPPFAFLTCIVVFGIMGCAPVGAVIGAVLGIIVGVVRGIRQPGRSEPEGREGVDPDRGRAV